MSTTNPESSVDGNGVLHVPARSLPAPMSVSAEARAILAMGPFAAGEHPPLHDTVAWRDEIAEADAVVSAMIAERAAAAAKEAEVQQVVEDGVPIYILTPTGTSAADRRVFLEIHGGALISGGGTLSRAWGLVALARTGIRTWAVDYRMPPDHPYPTPLDDCVTAYRALLRTYQPENIVIGGPSAGGNLAAATILRARDEGLPLPAGAVLLTPEADLTESGDSFQTLRGIDSVLSGELGPVNRLYAAGHDLAHPYLSPLFGDFEKGFPPTFLSAGTRDKFLSNAVRMHRALRNTGVHAELHILEAAPHGGFFGTAPEDHELDAEVKRFVAQHASAT